jgi:hypothetical protein
MVHFAADTEMVYMCSELKKKSLIFYSIQQRPNDGRNLCLLAPGNPVSKRIKNTLFFGKNVSKDSSLCIIDNCQVLRKRKKTMGRKKGK